MKKHLLKALSFALVCLSSNMNAQDELWFFGGHHTPWPFSSAGIYNNSGTITDSSKVANREFFEAITVVSNGSGKLLFYTDGIELTNKKHLTMPNGSGLLGSNESFGGTTGSACQGVLAVNDPGNPNKYYIFSVGDAIRLRDNGYNNGLLYHVVDMSLDGGFGDIAFPVGSNKNVLLMDGTSNPPMEALVAIPVSCDSTWIIAHSANNNNNFYAYLLTPAGLNANPVISSAGITIGRNDEARGAFAFSNTRSMLAMTCDQGVTIFDFNKQTGAVSSPNKIENEMFYGLEWSPDGLKLYYAKHFDTAKIKQYNVVNKKITDLNSPIFLGELVTGHDGKIYACANPTSFANKEIAAITNPNASDMNSAGFNPNYFTTSLVNGMGLPQTYFSPGFIGNTTVTATIAPPPSISICDTTSAFYLYATPSIGGNWTSSPSGFVNANGLFNPQFNSSDSTLVKVYFKMGACVIPDSVTVKVKSCCNRIGTIPFPSSICPGDVINLNALVTNGFGTWTIGTTPPPSPGKANATIVASTFTTNLITNPGDYKVVFTINNAVAGCKDTTNETVTVKTPPTNALDKAFDFCAGDSVLISAPVGPYNYSWSMGGGINPTKMVKAAGNYYLTTTGVNSCISKDTIVVSENSLPNVTPIDTSVCAGGALLFTAPNSFGGDYLWDDLTTGPTDNISTTGKHWVVIKNAKCQDTLRITINPGAPLNVSLNNPPNSCTGASITLTAAVTGVQTAPLAYQWNNAVGSASKVFTTGGNYTVEVTDARNCIGTDNATLAISLSPSVSLPGDTFKCFAEGEKLTVSVPDTFTTIKWNGVLSADSFYIASSVGTVNVIVSNAGGCLDTADIVLTEKCTELKWDFPNVFTPNGDGVNDHFYPFYVTNESITKLKKVHFEVYDRWGILMYKNDNLVIPEWDGKFNGNLVSPGVYYWIVRWTDTANTEGEKTGWAEIIYEK